MNLNKDIIKNVYFNHGIKLSFYSLLIVIIFQLMLNNLAILFFKNYCSYVFLFTYFILWIIPIGMLFVENKKLKVTIEIDNNSLKIIKGKFYKKIDLNSIYKIQRIDNGLYLGAYKTILINSNKKMVSRFVVSFDLRVYYNDYNYITLGGINDRFYNKLNRLVNK